MKIYFIGLLLISNAVSAQLWEELITTKSNTTYLIDPASIKKTGDIVKFAQLSNYPNGYAPDNQSIHSIQQVKEIDCKNELIKTISMIAYEGQNAKGGILNLSVGRDYQWAKINQNSTSGLYWDEVCK
jgi:hypothetical protein